MKKLSNAISHYSGSLLFDYDGSKMAYKDFELLIEKYVYCFADKSAIIIEPDASAIHSLAVVIACMKTNNVAILLPSTSAEDLVYLKNTYPHTHILSKNELNVCLEKKYNYPKGVNIILFTSGTGGHHRGVMLTRDNLMRNVESGVEHYYVEPESNIVCILPLYHGFGLNVSSLALICSGCNIYFANTSNYFLLIQKHSPSYFFLTPEILKMHIKMHSLVGFEKSFGSNPKYLFCGGDFIPEYLYHYSKQNSLELFSSYGLTEASPSVSAENLKNRRVGSVGIPIKCNQIEICNDEIVIRGSNVMYGYYDEYLGGKRLPHSILYTGDLGKKDNDGYLYITGRKKNLLVFSNGTKIHSEAIEAKLLKKFPECEFFVYMKNKVLCVEFYGDCLSEDIKQYLGSFISPYHSTALIMKKVQSFEKTYTGKIKRSSDL